MKLLAEQPERVIGQQVSFWGETLRHFAEAQAAFARGTLKAPPDESPRDRRFANPLWESHPFFNFIRRQYQINSQALEDAAGALDVPDMSDRRRITWFTRQMIDMMAPTNFLATNPDALEKAIATEGESLVKGLENLVRDIEGSGGELIVSLADRDAFRVGESTTDSTGGEAVNRPLSLDRAMSARDFLVDRGVAASRVGVTGRGEQEPIASNATEAGRAKNRRIEIFVGEPGK